MKINYSIFLLVLLIVPTVYAAVNYGDKSILRSVVTINNSFIISSTSTSYDIKFINASVNSFPRSDSRQTVTDLSTEPNADIGDKITFLYNNPTQSSYDLRIDAQVTSTSMVDEIKLPVNFPLNNLDSSLYSYLQPTEIIDVTPEIKNLASELIGDKTDMYEIEYAFAEYVRKNVAYDLSTLSSNVDQKSSWVLENKRGVCDEITNLFISLNRAAGIPSRFVSGIAYTNLDDVFGKSWVPHAWAEIFYPGYGWIPYDVTYGEYGFIDAGHIKLADSQESSGSYVNYNYLGNNIKLQPGPIDTDVKVLSYGDIVRGRYNFVADAYSDEVGFGSYDMLTVNVENTQNYYLVADLYLADTEGVSIIEDSKETVLNKTIHRKEVLLKPHQSSTVYWIVKIDDALDKNFVYTFPMTVYNTYNETSTSFITSKRDYKFIDEQFFKDLLASKVEESSKPYSKNIYLDCNTDKSSMYLEDTVNIDCVLDNRGDKTFDSIQICMDDNCTKQGLALEKIQLHYSKKFDSEGLKNIEVKTYNDEFTKVSYLPVNVLDKPNVSVNDLTYPDVVNYAEPFDITFTLSKVSKSSPKNLRIVLQSETNKVEWTFPDFAEDKAFTIKSGGETMKPNLNKYQITVYYEDEKGNPYNSEKDFIITSHATFLENILLYANLIGHAIEQVFTG